MASNNEQAPIVKELNVRLQHGYPIHVPGTKFVQDLVQALPGEDQQCYFRTLVSGMAAIYKKELRSPARSALALVWLQQVAYQLQSRGLASKTWIDKNVWRLTKNFIPPGQVVKSAPTEVFGGSSRDFRLRAGPNMTVVTQVVDQGFPVEPMQRVSHWGQSELSARSKNINPNSSPHCSQGSRILGVPRESEPSVTPLGLPHTTKPGPNLQQNTTIPINPSISSSSSGLHFEAAAPTGTPVSAPGSESKQSTGSSKRKGKKRAPWWRQGKKTGKVSAAGKSKVVKPVGPVELPPPSARDTERFLQMTSRGVGPDPKKARRDQEKMLCVVPGCGVRLERDMLREHSLGLHIPSIFCERANLEPNIVGIMVKALEMISIFIFGFKQELDSLYQFVSALPDILNLQHGTFSPLQISAMQNFCKFLNKPVPAHFTLYPANSVGVLLDWRVLTQLSASITEQQRLMWTRGFSGPETGLETGKPRKLEWPAFDSHYRVDRSIAAFGAPHSGKLENLRGMAPVGSGTEVHLLGTVAVYCDPKSYPSKGYLSTLSRVEYVAIGFHPKLAGKLSQGTLTQAIKALSELVKVPTVTAIGLIGFDHTEPMSKWQDQVELLHRILPFLQPRHALVIHCRGMKGDSEGDEFAIRSLLFHLKLCGVPQSQKIHFHCFTGTKSLLEIWRKQQPNTYFGFTRLAANFNQHQIAALRAIPDSKLLLESDAPYNAGTKGGNSTHYIIYETADVLARYRGADVGEILRVTTQNGITVYRR